MRSAPGAIFSPTGEPAPGSHPLPQRRAPAVTVFTGWPGRRNGAAVLILFPDVRAAAPPTAVDRTCPRRTPRSSGRKRTVTGNAGAGLRHEDLAAGRPRRRRGGRQAGRWRGDPAGAEVDPRAGGAHDSGFLAERHGGDPGLRPVPRRPPRLDQETEPGRGGVQRTVLSTPRSSTEVKPSTYPGRSGTAVQPGGGAVGLRCEHPHLLRRCVDCPGPTECSNWRARKARYPRPSRLVSRTNRKENV